MNLRSLLALILLTLPTATGCMLEVEAEGEPVDAWGQPLVAADQEQSDAELGADGEPLEELTPPESEDDELDRAQTADDAEQGDEGFTPWAQRTDPFPDPWMGRPSDGSGSSDE